jgi:hypothetical protein
VIVGGCPYPSLDADTETRRRFLVAKYDKKLFADTAYLEREKMQQGRIYLGALANILLDQKKLKHLLLGLLEQDAEFRTKMIGTFVHCNFLCS